MTYKNKIIIAIMILLSSCNNDDRIVNEIKVLTHRKISFVDGYNEFQCNCNISLDSLISQDLKIITYIDNISCTSCGIKTLKMLQKEIKLIDKDIAYIIVLHSENKDKFLKMTETLSLEYPIMYYQSNIFEKKNNLEGIFAKNKTFLLNKNNEIVIVGEPFGREKLTNLYRKTIDSLHNEYMKDL